MSETKVVEQCDSALKKLPATNIHDWSTPSLWIAWQTVWVLVMTVHMLLDTGSPLRSWSWITQKPKLHVSSTDWVYRTIVSPLSGHSFMNIWSSCRTHCGWGMYVCDQSLLVEISITTHSSFMGHEYANVAIDWVHYVVLNKFIRTSEIYLMHERHGARWSTKLQRHCKTYSSSRYKKTEQPLWYYSLENSACHTITLYAHSNMSNTVTVPHMQYRYRASNAPPTPKCTTW